MVNKKRLIGLTRKLIQLNSQNPPGNEFAIAGFVKKYLSGMGVESKIYEFKKNRSNLVAMIKGKGRKRSLLITPHLDTVPAGEHWRFLPFSGKLQGGRIYGLGATDCKGNLAVSLEAINSLAEDGASLDYSLVFAATADEESGSALGIAPLLDKGILKPDAALVLDADDFEIIVTQKGLLHLKIGIKGKKAHGAYPWLGRNAIDASMVILEELKDHWASRQRGRRTQYLQPATLNIGTIRGGDKVNVVADWCEFELDYRFLPGDSVKRILKEIKSVVKKQAARSQIEIEGIQKPYLIKTDHPLVSYLVKAMKRLGRKPCIKGSEGATTISFFQDKGIPAVATGFGCSGCAHIADEYVKIDNLYRGAAVLEEFLKQYRFD